jgi:hypothetical protein
LTRIKSDAFSHSSLESIAIPRNAQFIDGSGFCNVKLSSITIENGNNAFVVEKGLLTDHVCHKLIHNFSRSSKVDIPNDLEISGSNCFSSCQSLSSISFESNWLLVSIASRAPRFSETSRTLSETITRNWNGSGADAV